MKRLLFLLLGMLVVASFGWGAAWASNDPSQGPVDDSQDLTMPGQTSGPVEFMRTPCRENGPVIPPLPPIVVKPGSIGALSGDFTILPGGGGLLSPGGSAGTTVQESNRRIRRLIRRLG